MASQIVPALTDEVGEGALLGFAVEPTLLAKLPSLVPDPEDERVARLRVSKGTVVQALVVVRPADTGVAADPLAGGPGSLVSANPVDRRAARTMAQEMAIVMSAAAGNVDDAMVPLMLPPRGRQ